MAKTKGFLVDVPVTLTVCVRGTDNEEAAHKAARDFFGQIERIADDNHCKGYKAGDGMTVTEFSLESPSDESCETLEELED